MPQSSFYPSAPATSEWNHTPEPTPQQINPAPSYAPGSGADAIEEGFGVEDGGQILDSFLNYGVYYLNLWNSMKHHFFFLFVLHSLLLYEVIDLLRFYRWDFNHFLLVAFRTHIFT